MRVLDLFSGIGGFSLGLERAGMRTVAFCEIDPYCRAVLAKHWPGVPIHGDIREFKGVKCDVICGGFPCQDISVAGKGAGLAGARSGLWSEYRRLIGELRPSYVIVENVSALLGRGLGEVLGDLAALGYDAEWHCIPASYVGAPHRRDRIWIVAYAGERGHGIIFQPLGELGGSPEADSGGDGEALPMADSDHQRLQRRIREGVPKRASERPLGAGDSPVADADDMRELQPQGSEPLEWGRAGDSRWWSIEPDVGRVAHGVPARVDRLRSLGNAVVPQVVEVIGRAIMEQTL